MPEEGTIPSHSAIKPIDKTSIHRITSGQVVIDLQTAVKELVENSFDAGATNIEVRFKQYGLTSIEVIDNGCGIAEEDHESIGLKHHTSKLATYTDLAALLTFGFRGEALSSLCALCQSVQVTTSTKAPVGVCLDLDASGRVKSRKTVARPKGTTVSLKGLFHPLPVRRKELERNIKREFAKALNLLNAYALLPCTVEPGIRLTVSNQPDKGQKSQLLSTQGVPSIRASVTALWGPKSLDTIVDLDIELEVEKEKRSKRTTSQSLSVEDEEPFQVRVTGLISKFNVSCGRTGTDRQFFYVNGRPCTFNKIQKTFNEVYRSFNATQSPFVVANFVLPTEICDVNVVPDKRTIFLHSEGNLVTALKVALEKHFNPARSTFDIAATPAKPVQTSLDYLSTTRPRLTVTNNTLRHNLRWSSSGDDTGEHQQDDRSITPAPSHSSVSSPPAIANTQKHPEISHNPTPDTPLFIPDPEDDLPVASSETEHTMNDKPNVAEGAVESTPADRHLRRKRDSDDNGVEEVVIDTTRASWNLPSYSQSVSSSAGPPDLRQDTGKDGSTSARSAEADQAEFDEEGPVRKKRKAETERLQDEFIPTVRSERIGGVGEQEVVPRRTGSGSRAKPSVVGAQVRKGQLSMHKFLVGFASSSSQPQSVDADQDEDDIDASSTTSDDQADDLPHEPPEKSPPVTRQADSPLDHAVDVDVQQAASVPMGDCLRPGPTESSDTQQDDMEVDELDTTSVLSSVQQSISSGSALSRGAEAVPRPEIIRSGDGNDVTLKFDFSRVKSSWSKLTAMRQADQVETIATSGGTEELEDAGLSNTENEARAAEALSRIIDKTDFSTMDVVGQFNLGFIVARRKKSDPLSGHTMDDLFIVDQHAADEKYNFETLQQQTNIQSQRLFMSRSLELTAADELVATENIDILRKNGFEIDIDGSAPSGSRLKLSAQPVSKCTVFDTRDLEELIHLMRDRPNGQMVRCSKARTMFAMRACRKSVMIGMPLNRHQMLNVVRHMGTIDQPWNCPHGRPTMRHLVDLADAKVDKKIVDWRRLVTKG